MTVVPVSQPGSFGSGVRPIIAGLTILAAASLLAAWTLDTSDQPTTAVFWGGLSLAALTFTPLCLLRGGVLRHGLEPGRWKIGSLMLVRYALAYGATTVSWSRLQVETATKINVLSVLRTLWLVAVDSTADYLIRLG